MAYKQKMGRNHCSEGPLSMGSPLNNESKFNTTQYQNVVGGGTKKWIGMGEEERRELRQGIATNLDAGLTLSGVGAIFKGIKGLFSAGRAAMPLVKEGIKSYAQSKVKSKFDSLNSSGNVEDNSVPNVTSEAFNANPKSESITTKNDIYEANVLSMRSPLNSKEGRAERKEFRVERAAERRSKKGKEPRRTTKGKGRNFRTTEEGAGMTAKGVASYKAKNPGSNLQTAVTGEVKAGSKAAKRRKSFCARSKGWTGERGKAARARWNC